MLFRRKKKLMDKESKNELNFTLEEIQANKEIAEALREQAKEAGYNHKAVIEFDDGHKEMYDYYWVDGEGGKLRLHAALKDSQDSIITIDLKKNINIKQVHLC